MFGHFQNVHVRALVLPGGLQTRRKWKDGDRKRHFWTQTSHVCHSLLFSPSLCLRFIPGLFTCARLDSANWTSLDGMLPG